MAAGSAVEGGGCSEDNDMEVCGRGEIFTVSVIKSNVLGNSELFWRSAVHLDGVDVFCWGSGVRRVSALVHGGRSRGNDRNLRTQRGATALVRDSEGQQPIKKKRKMFCVVRRRMYLCGLRLDRNRGGLR